VPVEQWLLISISYIAPLVFAALFLAAPRRPPHWLMAVVLLGLPGFYVIHYVGLQTIQGWPSHSALPQIFKLEAFKVIEPQPSSNEEGAILLWASTPEQMIPRAYRLDYRRSLHSELVSAGQRLSAGKPQVGRTTSRPTNGEAGIAAIRFENEEPAGLPAKEGTPE
jgi:hypothetical protein